MGIIDHFFLHPRATWENFNVLTFTLEKMNGFNKINGNVKLFSIAKDSPIINQELIDANHIKLSWCSKGKKALIKTESYSDSTNKSYYGKTKLFHMDLNKPDPKLVF